MVRISIDRCFYTLFLYHSTRCFERNNIKIFRDNFFPPESEGNMCRVTTLSVRKINGGIAIGTNERVYRRGGSRYSTVCA